MGRIGRLVIAGGAGTLAGPSRRQLNGRTGTGNSPRAGVRQSIAVSRPVTAGDIPRDGHLSVIASEGVWSHEQANEPAYRGIDGRMREAVAYRERKTVGRVVARDLATGGKVSASANYATLAGSYGIRRKDRS